MYLRWEVRLFVVNGSNEKMDMVASVQESTVESRSRPGETVASCPFIHSNAMHTVTIEETRKRQGALA